MERGAAMLAGMGLGAGLMYVFDPRRADGAALWQGISWLGWLTRPKMRPTWSPAT